MKNGPNMNPDLAKAAEAAQFRFGLIAPVLQGTCPDKSAKKYYQRVAATASITMPDGRPMKYSWKTLEKWTSLYKRYGFDALMPVTRKDKGASRALPDIAIERIYALKQEFPRMNATQIYHQLIKESFIDSTVNVCTVQRFIKKILICTRVVFIGLFIDIFSHPVPISHFSWCV